ncbi:DUF2442 domain-containing protein [Acetobacter pasteurianus]|uniref:DUF2442 domain-containing protein n=2 Tax=Acetobacter pasteurianus TaxID=438 RepID=A0AAC9SQA9_ACEPA|nr:MULTISPECIES: DUF2442 domain-containing protein [Acetobacter]ASC05343.1 hypothetical protein S101468_01077 [Acetobacter pasteurianus subsp. pasteurianus]GCD64746.1 hypothetical protein NBRC3279_0237 [Acetobacter pasteurianus NBRC 3279]GCD71078.1 hypothetical protein NBRC3284_0234 [Acetobacter pasteurianus NBRC 3284]
MPILAARFDPTATDVRMDTDLLHVVMADGRELSVPLEWFPRLRDASPEQRSHWRFIGRGKGIHWPDVDEDISVASLLRLS